MANLFPAHQIKNLSIPQIKAAFKSVEFLDPWYIRLYLKLEKLNGSRIGAIDAINSFDFRMRRLKRKRISSQTPDENLLDHYREIELQLEDLEEDLRLENAAWDACLAMGKDEGDIVPILNLHAKRDELWEKRKEMDLKHDWLSTGSIPRKEVPNG